jgi:putative nucleotidyltransferase with HDIG domain
MSMPLDPVIRDRLAQLIERGELRLPLLPEAASQVMVLVDRPDCDTRRLADVIRRDPALTAHVLRIASTPAYAAQTKVVSLQQVIGRLGFATILQIALVIASRTRVFEVTGFETEVRGAFRHSFATALFAQEIARARRATVDSAFIAGLLHDIGRPLLLQALIDLHRDAKIAPERQAILAAADEAHADVGGLLADSWALPPRVAEAVRKHHAPAGCELAMMVALADSLAHAALDGGEPAVTEHAAPLNLYPEDVAALVARSADIVTTVEAIA